MAALSAETKFDDYSIDRKIMAGKTQLSNKKQQNEVNHNHPNVKKQLSKHKKQYHKIYCQINKEKIKEHRQLRNKIPTMKESRAKYNKEYYARNKQKIKERRAARNYARKQTIKEHSRNSTTSNPELLETSGLVEVSDSETDIE